MSRYVKVVGLLLFALLLAGAGAWSALALAHLGPRDGTQRGVLVAAVALSTLAALAALALPRWRGRAVVGLLAVFAGRRSKRLS